MTSGVVKKDKVKSRGADLFYSLPENGEKVIDFHRGQWVSLLVRKNKVGCMEFNRAQIIDLNLQNGTLAIRYFRSGDNDRGKGDRPWLGLGEVKEEREDFKFDEVIKIVALHD